MSAENLINGVLGGSGGNAAVDLTQLAGGLLPNPGEELADKLAAVAKNLEGLASTSQLQAEAVGTNTQAIVQNTVAQSSGAKGVASTIGKAASSIFGSGLGLSPLISGITKLFGGGGTEEPAALVKYQPPTELHLEGTNPSGSTIWSPRVDVGGSSTTVVPDQVNSPATPQQVTIQVQAMDSRSFMDHSGDIARAVREAMLNMSSLNDVVNDL